jgi:hypothetical protein
VANSIERLTNLNVEVGGHKEELYMSMTKNNKIAYVEEHRQEFGSRLFKYVQHFKSGEPDPKMVSVFFDLFHNLIGHLPSVYRSEIFKLCQPQVINVLDRVLTPDTENPGMYFVCKGTAIVI